jgi:hypothetical protein
VFGIFFLYKTGSHYITHTCFELLDIRKLFTSDSLCWKYRCDMLHPDKGLKIVFLEIWSHIVVQLIVKLAV